MAKVNRQQIDEKLVAALAAGNTVRDAAVAAGVVERTVYRRLADVTFKARVMDARAQAVARAAAALSAGMSEATAVLKSLLTEANPRIRQQAAAKLLEFGARLHTQMEIERRLEELERFLAVPPPSARPSVRNRTLPRSTPN